MKKSEIVKNPNAEAEGLSLSQAFGVAKERSGEIEEATKKFFREQIEKKEKSGKISLLELAADIEENFTQEEINYFLVNSFSSYILRNRY